MDTCTSYLRPVPCLYRGSAWDSALERSKSTTLWSALDDWTNKEPSLHLRGNQDLVSLPRAVGAGLVLLWNLNHHDRSTECPTAFPALVLLQPLPSHQNVLHADPHPSLVPGSGNLRPVRFITLRRSLLQIVPVPISPSSTSLSGHTGLLLPLRLNSRLHTPPPTPPWQTSRYRHANSQVAASTPRGRTTIVILRVQKLPKTDQLHGA